MVEPTPIGGPQGEPDPPVQTPVGPRFWKPSEISDAWGFNFLLYGLEGSGKTTLAATAAKCEEGRKVLFLDIEGGVRSISDFTDVEVFQVQRWSHLDMMHDWVQTHDHEFKTFVIDSGTAAQELYLLTKTGGTRMPEIQEWGMNNEAMKDLARKWRLLSQTRGWNVIITALYREQKDEASGAVLGRPAMAPQAQEQVRGVLDAVGLLSRIQDAEGRDHRRLLFKETQRTVGKFRQPQTGVLVEEEIIDPDLSNILPVVRRRGTTAEE